MYLSRQGHLHLLGFDKGEHNSSSYIKNFDIYIHTNQRKVQCVAWYAGMLSVPGNRGSLKLNTKTSSVGTTVSEES